MTRFFLNLSFFGVLSAGLTTMLCLAACNGGSSTGYGGDGNPTPREFASGNLNGGQSFTHVFNTAKSVPYYCRYHRTMGMTGVITVNAGGTANRTNVSITGYTLPSLTIDVGDTITWTNNHTSTYGYVVHTVESDN